MSTGLIIALVLALIAGVVLVLRSQRPALPEARRGALPGAEAADDEVDSGREPTTLDPEDPPTVRDPTPAVPVADLLAGAPTPVPPPEAPPAAKLEPSAAPQLTPVAAPEPAALLRPEPTPAPVAPAPVAPPPPVIAPPPVIKPVPLPVDKPRAREPTPEDLRTKERQRYRDGLAKTRGGFVARLARLFKGKPRVDDDLRDEIEEVLFTADIGASTAQKLQARVTEILDKKEVADPDAVWAVIREAAFELLDIEAPPLDYTPAPGPYVLLMIGVNGVGKTTTLGKLAALHVAAGRKVLLVGGDTFRAAAVEQLDVWARRVGCDIHSGADRADPSSVIFDGITRARNEGHDVVLCDTAGRLHTRKELMDELAKVGRSAAKALQKGREDGPAAAHDIFLVLDATIGQNALAQAKLFKETMEFTGLVVTKLDGTAKGGVVLGICDELNIPIRFVGIGEGVDDLRPFDAEAFCDALLADRDREAEA